MGTKKSSKTQIFLVLTLTAYLFCAGCGEGMKYKPIYNSAIFGGIVGAIVGHQSDKTGQGIAIGAGVGAFGEFLHQLDMHPDASRPRPQQTRANTQPPELKTAPARPSASGNIMETFIVQIHNDNGSITPVEIRKEGNKYIGPTGEQYDKMPTEEDLKPIYGL